MWQFLRWKQQAQQNDLSSTWSKAGQIYQQTLFIGKYGFPKIDANTNLIFEVIN